MILNKITQWAEKHKVLTLAFTGFILIMSIAGTLTAYALYKYWFPPVAAISNTDLGTQAILHTGKGDIYIDLSTKARYANAQFVKYSKLGFYDGTRITRVVKNLLIEGGDPLSKYSETRNLWGQGGSAAVFKNEVFLDDNFDRGTFALTGSALNTFGSQFFISTKRTDWLKGKHTIKGNGNSGLH